MTTQVIFKIDKKIKEQAQKKAKQQGTTYSKVLTVATHAFLDGLFVPAFIPTERFKEYIKYIKSLK